MRSRAIEAIKATLTLTTRQREVLVGLLLGDGHLECSSHTPRARLKVEQSEKAAEYVRWLHNVFHEWIPGGIKSKTTFLQQTGRTYSKHYFNTYSHAAFLSYHHLFYRGRKKIVPSTIAELLTPLGFAIRFMDDGSIKSHESRGSILNKLPFSIRVNNSA